MYTEAFGRHLVDLKAECWKLIKFPHMFQCSSCSLCVSVSDSCTWNPAILSPSCNLPLEGLSIRKMWLHCAGALLSMREPNLAESVSRGALVEQVRDSRGPAFWKSGVSCWCSFLKIQYDRHGHAQRGKVVRKSFCVKSHMPQ